MIGGCGDYLELADRVVLMEAFRPKEVTARAREIAERFPTGRRSVSPAPPPREPSGRRKGQGIRPEGAPLRRGAGRPLPGPGPASPQKPLSELVSETIALAQEEDLYRLGRSPELAATINRLRRLQVVQLR